MPAELVPVPGRVAVAGRGRCVSYGRLPSASEVHRHRRGVGFQPRRLGAGNLRQSRVLRLSGQALPGQSEAQRAVGPAGLSEFRRDPGAGRSRARPSSRRSSIPDTLAEAAAHGLQMRADLCGAIRRGRRRRRARRARRRCRRCPTSTACASPARTAWARWRLREKLLLYPAKRVRALRPGSVGVVFQSGGTFQFWLQQASLRGLDFSYAVSSGNELDLDLADYINFLVDDEHTKIIACLVEGIRRPQAFMAAAEKALAARKPILLVKVGRSERGKAATASHTGAIAGDDAGVRRGVPQIRHRALPVARRPDRDLPRLHARAACRRARASPWPATPAAPRAWCSTTPATKAPRWRRSRRRRKAKLPGMIDPGLARGKSARRRPDGRRAGGEVRRDLQGRLRRPDCRSRHRAGPDAGQPRRSVQSRAAAQRRWRRPTSRCWRSAASRRTPPRSAANSRARPACRSSRACRKRCARCRAWCATRRRCGAASPPLPEPRGRAASLDGAAFDALLAEHGLTPPRSALARTRGRGRGASRRDRLSGGA